MADEHVDILIVGAGLSGVGAACHVRESLPGKSFAILEAREDMGGTWDLFRYPGIRSDSDMFTLGYSFRPWRKAEAIADGPSILRYIRDTGVSDYTATPGNHGVQILMRTHDGRTDFTILSYWESMEAIKAFAGDQPEVSRYYPEDDEYLIDNFDEIDAAYQDWKSR